MAAIPFPAPAFGPAPRRTIPFDYSFTFELRGERDRIAVAKVEVSVEASFVATAIGYGFRPTAERIVFGGKPREFATSVSVAPLVEGFGASAAVVSAPQPPGILLSHITIGQVVALAAKHLQALQEGRSRTVRDTGAAPPARELQGDALAAVLESGFRLNPEVARQVLLGKPSDPIDESLLPRLFEIVGLPPEDIQFLYAISDAGSGREFQSEPILNTAGLGDPRGVRPFRQFAAPIVFEPRTTIRMEVTELQTARGTLHVSLHGYKVLGGAGTPTGERAGTPAASSARRGAGRTRR